MSALTLSKLESHLWGAAVLLRGTISGGIASNKNRLQRQIILEVALKTRDTVAGLLGAGRSAVTEFPAEGLVAAMQAGRMVTVVIIIVR